MKRGICVFVVLLLLLCGCTGQTNPSASKDHFIIDGNRTYVAPFGEVPAAFQFAIDNGILKNAKASKDRIFTTELVSGGYQITMYDLSFKQLVSWQLRNWMSAIM